jgi:hypothetical protein
MGVQFNTGNITTYDDEEVVAAAQEHEPAAAAESDDTKSAESDKPGDSAVDYVFYRQVCLESPHCRIHTHALLLLRDASISRDVTSLSVSRTLTRLCDSSLCSSGRCKSTLRRQRSVMQILGGANSCSL